MMQTKEKDMKTYVAFWERIIILIERLAFRRALLEISEQPQWRKDPDALFLVGMVMRRFAPHSIDRRCAYGCARNFYRAAGSRSKDFVFRAAALAQIGHTYFEEGALGEALTAFEQGVLLAPAYRDAHL